MRERFSSADLRFLLVCGLLLAATVWFSASFFYRAFPEASIDFRVTREEAGAIARRFLDEQGYRPGAYRQASKFDFDAHAKTFLERELGLERANGLMGRRVRLWRWSYRWFRPQQKEEFRVDVTPGGEPVGFEHQLPEAEARPSLSSEQARSLAEGFLRGRMRRDPAALDFVEASSRARPARTDHVFTWKERDFSVRDATYRVEVSVLGNEVGGYREYLKVPEAWLREYGRLRSANEAAQYVDSALMALLGVGLLATIVQRVRRHDVRWGRAAAVGCIGAALTFLASWNAHPLSEFSYPTTDSYASFLTSSFVRYLLGALAGGGFLLLLTAGAEPLYRERFPGRISLANLFRPRGLRTRSFFKGAVLGLALTGVFVAYQIAFYLLAYRFGAWSPADVPYDDLLNTRFPWLFVLLMGFMPAVSEEFLFRVFAIPYLEKLLRSTAAALLLAGFIWGFGHAGYPQQPFYIRGLEVGLGGVVLGIVILRWGVLPVLIWHYSVDALYTALLLLRSHSLYYVLSGAACAGIMVLPVVWAWLAYKRHGGFEPEADLWNAREGSAPEPAAAPEPEPQPAAAYSGWSPRRRLAAALLTAAALAFLLVPAPKFEPPLFSLDGAQARVRAAAFLRDQGARADSFRTVAYPAPRWEWEALKYFGERLPVGGVSARQAYIPSQAWMVRFFKPLDKEEWLVSIHPASGAVIGFDHRLPEERPGATLAPAAARELAAGALLAFALDPARLDLKETSSEDKKARRDHNLIFEAAAGDPRNLAECRYRVRVQVAGDRVVQVSPFWKLPESFLRARSRRNALSNTLGILRMAGILAIVVSGLALLVIYTRRRQFRWRTALTAALPLALLAATAAAVELPLTYRSYDTAIPLDTFRAMLVTGLVIAAVGVFLGLAAATGLLLALRAGCAAALARSRRRVLAGDALLAVLLALALALFVAHFRAWVRSGFPAQAIWSAGAPGLFASPLPALSAASGAAATALFSLAALALAGHLALRVIRRRWLSALLIALAAVSTVSPRVLTGGEFLAAAVPPLLGAVLVVGYCIWFAGGNDLAYLLAAWVLALYRPAVDLLAQPAPALRIQGWMLLAVLALGLLWGLAPGIRRRAVDLTQVAGRG